MGKDLNFILLDQLKMLLYVTNTSSNGYGNIKIEAPIGDIDTLFTLLPPSETIAQIPPVNIKSVVEIKLITESGIPISNGKIFIDQGESLEHMENIGNGRYMYDESAIADQSIFQAHAPGFIPKEVKYNGGKELTIALMKADIGITVTLDNVLFEQASTVMLPGSERDLDLVVDLLEENPNVKIELSGHTDDRGPASKNVKLSKKRVNSVKDYLVEKGIKSNRISGKGYGGSKPIASNEVEETRKLNRRVEFTIVEN